MERRGGGGGGGGRSAKQMCPVMSWLLCLCLWVSGTAVQLGQGTFYDTIQQQHGTRPGRISIHTIGEYWGSVASWETTR
ncbi:unnamed protein product [Merluccius merluccius]